ncbi:MAG: hypothetical protein AAGM84_11080 [Pseudomonadota bacterium]
MARIARLKLEDKLMKRLFRLIAAATLFTWGATLASAYCVQNQTDDYAVVFQLPLTSQSFKQVLRPDQKKCCNWRNFSCNAQTYPGAANRFGFTPMVVGLYSSYSKAKSKKDEIQTGAVFNDIFKTVAIAAAAYKRCVKCAKKAILLIDDISEQIFRHQYKCSGLLQNGAGLGISRSRCTSYDIIPTNFWGMTIGSAKKSGKQKNPRVLSDEPEEYVFTRGVTMPKLNGDSFEWLPWIR